ncbi:MAG: ATP-binding cassette domain-containing protein [Brevibacillus sp.]|nr:ATP-binding cassette domain-containing protein [Brevibacillus sp.]
MSRQVMLSFEGVNKSFGGVTAVANSTFEVPAGAIVALIGPNGAGKTSTFNCITGMYTPDSGRILFNGQPIHHLKPHEIARCGLSRTFQNLQVFHNLTVLENVLVACRATRQAGLLPAMLRLPRIRQQEQEAERLALKLLGDVGLAHKAESSAKDLSFGEQRLLEVARALAVEPKLLLLDEPMSGLSREEVAAMVKLLKRLRADGLTILLIEHDVSTVMEVADQIVVLEFGTPIAVGTPEEIRTNPRVIEAYLGQENQEWTPLLGGKRNTSEETVLTVRNLDAYRGSIHVLRDVSLEVRKNELVTIIGANGAGKSTLLAAISGLIPAAAGQVIVHGQEVQGKTAEQLASIGINHVPERRGMFPELTVEQSLLLGAYTRRKGTKAGETGAEAVQEDLERMYTLFPRLRERKKQLAGTLSGGEQQMLAIARGLMARPQLLMLDEPSLGLAPLIVAEIFEKLCELKEQGMTILLVEQNARAALRIADRVYTLERGTIQFSGTPEELLADARLNQTFLAGH